MRVKVAGLAPPLVRLERDVPVGTPGAALCVTMGGMGVLSDLADDLRLRLVVFSQIGIVLEQFRFQQRLKIVGKGAVCICRGDRNLDAVAGKMDKRGKLALQRDFYLGSSRNLAPEMELPPTPRRRNMRWLGTLKRGSSCPPKLSDCGLAAGGEPAE